MVKKTLSLFHKEIRGISHAAYFLAGFSLLSQILALLRDRLFASMFGADRALDVYYAAFRIPDFIFVIVSTLVSVSVLIPLIHEAELKGKEEVKKILSTVFTALFVCLTIVAGIAYLLAPIVIPRIFPQYNTDHATLITLTRLLLVSPLLLGFSNLCASVTQARRRFLLYGLSPVLYNVGIILGALILYPVYGMKGLGIGVILGAALHGAVQVPYLVREGLMPTFIRIRESTLLTKVVITSLPRTLSLSISEIVEFILVIIAGTLPFGSISVFTLSWNLQSVPLAMIGVSYAIALFPVLSKLSVEKDMVLFVEKLSHTLRQIVFLGALVMAVFIIVRAHMVRTVFGAGLFSWEDTRLTAAALAFFIVSFIPQCFILILTRAFNAIHDTRTPFLTNIISGLVTILGAGILLWGAGTDRGIWLLSVLVRNGVTNHALVLVLPLAFSVGAWINAWLLLVLFEKRVPGILGPVRHSLVVHVGTLIVASVVAYGVLRGAVSIFNTTQLLGIFGQGLVAGLVAIVVACGVLYVLKNREILELIQGITTSQRKPVAGPDVSV